MFEITDNVSGIPYYIDTVETINDVYNVINRFYSKKQAVEASSWAERALYDDYYYDDYDEFSIHCI